MTEIAAIAVVGKNRVIGDGVDQPFKIPADWAYFKRTTMGHPLIVGRKTFTAIGRHLLGRTMVIVSKTPEAVEVSETGFAVGAVESALALACELDHEIVFVAGGGQIYRQTWDYLDTLLITEVDQEAQGSVTFPEIDATVWQEVWREPHDGFAFVKYLRR